MTTLLEEHGARNCPGVPDLFKDVAHAETIREDSALSPGTDLRRASTRHAETCASCGLCLVECARSRHPAAQTDMWVWIEELTRQRLRGGVEGDRHHLATDSIERAFCKVLESNEYGTTELSQKANDGVPLIAMLRETVKWSFLTEWRDLAADNKTAVESRFDPTDRDSPETRDALGRLGSTKILEAFTPQDELELRNDAARALADIANRQVAKTKESRRNLAKVFWHAFIIAGIDGSHVTQRTLEAQTDESQATISRYRKDFLSEVHQILESDTHIDEWVRQFITQRLLQAFPTQENRRKNCGEKL